MLKSDVLHFLERVLPNDLAKVVMVMRGNQAINVETVFHHEESYVIVRGRESGSNDENRAFFLPYDEIAYIKIERIVMLSDLEQMYKKPAPESEPAKAASAETGTATTPPPAEVPTPLPVPAALDPAAIARNNLLERIRAARSTVGHATNIRAPK